MSRGLALAWMICSAMVGGCAATRAPVSEHGVADYRRAGNPPGTPGGGVPVSKPAPAAAKTPVPVAAMPAPVLTSSPKGRATAKEGAEEDARPETYTVKRGDTLYSIALDNGLDYKELAAWNQISDPNVIRVDRPLRLRAPAGWKSDSAGADEAVTRPLAATPSVQGQPLDMAVPTKSQPKGIKVPYSEAALAQLTRFPDRAPVIGAAPSSVEAKLDAKPDARTQAPAASLPTAPPSAPVTKPQTVPPLAVPPTPKPDVTAGDGAIQWVWPAAGKLIHAFNQGANPKGVAIGGASGQPIVASATGKVVYSGSGLRGYGKLIIIKHDNTYLSVYAHNRELLVKEGERVSRGQRIAEMGSSGSERAELHFEIRRFGKPVDPLKFLPPEGPS